ncbi:polyprenal reductase isoform X2 [Hetaerina americana]|uniref:polyprenal reductase isoform X2 n=1 Tax=Hetaerina americana TaxID=62018 RepID=UPI003A7F557E
MSYFVDFNVSIVKLAFGLMTLGVFITSIFVIIFEKYLPRFLIDTYKYGKFAVKNPSKFIIVVPKSWFRHFYIVGTICTGMTMVIMINGCLFGRKPPALLLSFLDVVDSKKRIPSGSAVGSVVGISLLFVHCIARLWETHFISVFSQSNINIVHYVCGIVHYIGSAVAILAEAPGFSHGAECSFSWNELTFAECCVVFIFGLASFEQLKCSIILASLRKNKTGAVRTYKHSIPTGRLFEVLSSPHLVAEIIMYMALTYILRSNQTWWFIFTWVLTNQCAVAWMNHKWYQNNFPGYPKVRKALIPYVF